jgi:hypothetical protein
MNYTYQELLELLQSLPKELLSQKVTIQKERYITEISSKKHPHKFCLVIKKN